MKIEYIRTKLHVCKLYKHVIIIMCHYNVLQLFLRDFTISTHPSHSDG